jgi:two-component system sensor histidine kinase BaeS
MNRLRIRLLLLALLPLLIILPTVVLASGTLLQSQVVFKGLLSDFSRQALLTAELASTRPEIWNNRRLAQDFLSRIADIIPEKIELLDANGYLLASSDEGDLLQIGTRFEFEMPTLGQRSAIWVQVGEQDEGIMVPVSDSQGHTIGYVLLSTPLAELSRRTESLRWILLAAGIGGLFLGILLALWLANDLEKPIDRLVRTSYDLALGTSSPHPLPEAGPEELRLLARVFNAFLERLTMLEETRRRLLANLVHEIGTPLGALLSASQALLSGAKENPDLRDELLQGMDQELRRLCRLTDELAHLHEKALGGFELNFQELNTPEWLVKSLSTWATKAREKNLQWQVSIPSNLPPLLADPDRLAQAINNLVSNAIRYTPPGSWVKIKAEAIDKVLRIEVCDNGPGIPKEEQEAIFEPFHRGKAAKRFPRGMGLGLTIARDLVRAHGGDIHLRSTPGQGSCFSIQLPIEPPSP